MDCSVANFYDNVGNTNLTTGATGTYSPGDLVQLSTRITPKSGLSSFPPAKIKVTTPTCGGLSDTVENDSITLIGGSTPAVQ